MTRTREDNTPAGRVADTLLLTNCRLYNEPASAPLAQVAIRDGKIAHIGPGMPGAAADKVVDAEGRMLIPGLIDMHVHGAGGADVTDGTPEALREMSRALARLGTTAFLGTTFLSPSQENRHLPLAAQAVGADLGGARLIGLYLEGPFLNPKRRGGLPEDAVRPPDIALLDELLDLTDGALRVMTIAPELPGALPIIERLAERGIIPSFGHSDATFEEARAGLQAGIRHVTHLYNAMPGMHHRAPGPLLAIQEAGDITVELISDGVHVDPEVVRWTRDLIGPTRQICITDSMRTAGLPDGRYRYGGKDFEARDGAARYLDGTLIGTSLSLFEVVLRYQEFTGCSFDEAVDSASRRPARLLGLNKGALEVGKDADLVLLDEDRSVWITVVDGCIAH